MNSINSIIGMEVCTYLTSDFYRQIYCVPSNLFLCTEENTRIPLLYTLANTEDFLFVSFWHNVPPPTQHNNTDTKHSKQNERYFISSAKYEENKGKLSIVRNK